MPRPQRRSLTPLEERNKIHNHRHDSHRPDCRLCHKDHPLRKCIKFKKMNVSEKLKVVKKHRYCENCLAHSHLVTRCRNTDRCHQCGRRHHTLLHRHVRLRTPIPNKPQSCSIARTVTFLPTVVLKVELGDEWSNVRGLLNPCVEFSSIAEFLTKRYKLNETKIGSERWCTIRIRPRFDDGPIFNVTAKVVVDLPRNQPKEQVDERVAGLYANLHLADPNFYKNIEINIVLGADIYPRLIKPSVQTELVGSPMAQDTLLGWTIIGKFGV